MSQEEVDRRETVDASAGLLFYRRGGGEIEVLTATRQNQPWQGHTAVEFGGLTKDRDKSVAHTALREGHEETGGTLRLHNALRLIGIYGPQNFWHELKRRYDELVAVPTPIPISERCFVHIVYAAEVLSGEPVETPEMRNFSWAKPLDLADEGRQFTFENALVLADFWHKICHHSSWKDPATASWFYTPRD